MSDCKREERYTVVKHKDISTAQLKRLRSYLATNGMPTRTCVVAEPDWPIYGLVWQMIESLSNGKVPIDPKVLAADLNAALEREQALAAHGERLHCAFDNVLAEIVSESNGSLSDIAKEGLRALDDEPGTTSLSQRKLIKQSVIDPHPNCEIECGAYGTYCKCNDEGHQ